MRCARCRAVWHAEPTRSDLLVAAADALGPNLSEKAPGRSEVPQAGEAPNPAAPFGSSEVSLADYRHDAAGDMRQSLDSGAEEPSDPVEPALALDSSLDSEPGPGDPAGVEAPPLAPSDLDAAPLLDVQADDPDSLAHAPDHIETAAANPAFPRPVRRHQSGWSLSRLQIAMVVLVILDCVVIGWRKDIVRILPQTASFYRLLGLSVNLRGLTFEDVATSTEVHDGVPILVVEGNIVNRTGTMADVPRLKMAVRNSATQEIYSWTAAPPRATLPGGEAIGFRTRLASPPPESHDVVVRFVTRRDIVAETH